MITIGLLGSIAAGKSEVSRLLAARGARILDADLVAHQTYAPGAPGHQLLVEAFGDAVLDDAGAVDRGKLANVVFGDPEQLARLNSIVWPLTRRLVENLKAEAEAEGAAVLVIEAPLLVEAGWQDLVDQLWFVKTAPEIALHRLRARGLSDEAARARIAARPVIAGAEAAADAIIENSGSLADLSGRVEELWIMLESKVRE